MKVGTTNPTNPTAGGGKNQENVGYVGYVSSPSEFSDSMSDDVNSETESAGVDTSLGLLSLCCVVVLSCFITVMSRDC